MAAIFHQSFEPDKVHFSNDNPLGLLNTLALRLPDGFTGWWLDLNAYGLNGGGAGPGLTSFLRTLFGPVLYSKFYTPFTLFFVGLCAWFCFRCMKFAPVVCVLGGVAAALNSDFFSTSCWGAGSQIITFGYHFLALAAIAGLTHRRLLRPVLAGMAIGLGIMEGADIGAIFSLFTAACFFYSVVIEEGSISKKVVFGIGQVALAAVFAAFIAAHALTVLIGTQIQGVAGTQQDSQTKAARWNFATQWSMPKQETLALIVPGFFGYRMDTPGGGNYWGGVGRDASWQSYFDYHTKGKLSGGEILRLSSTNQAFNQALQGSRGMAQVRNDGTVNLPLVGEIKAKGLTIEELSREIMKRAASQTPVQDVSVAVTAQGFTRYTGGGNYAGVLVIIVALWATFQSFRKGNSVFSATERKLVWFWAGVVVIALLLAWGRYAPFYQIFYALPYSSTIRNPCKFLHVFSFAMIILFAYGLQGLSRRYLEVAMATVSAGGSRFKTWWSHAATFDRRWVFGGVAAVILGFLAWLYVAHSTQLENHLLNLMQLEVQAQGGRIDLDRAQEFAHSQAMSSAKQLGWAVAFLAMTVAVLIGIFSGAFAGRRSRWAGVLLGALLLSDLIRANQPWLVFWDYKEKYASNPIIDFLRDKPYEHRVIKLPFSPESKFNDLYNIQWIQQLFPYYNIQSLDIVQLPRMPQDMESFESALLSGANTDIAYLRRWQLSNTRYFLGPAGFLTPLNEQLDSVRRRFRIVARFDVIPKPNINLPIGLSREQLQQAANMVPLEQLTAQPDPNGEYALFEFIGALPRAVMYSNWETSTNDTATLKTISSGSFNPEQLVIVASPTPFAPDTNNPTTFTVEFAGYEPKHITLKTSAENPSVLLLNDKYDPNWRVLIDGKPSELLRCNFIMRGAAVPAGSHTVEFLFQPSVKALYVSLAAISLGVLLLGYVIIRPSSSIGRKSTASDKPQRTSPSK
jgi:hypothetical protein